MGTRLLDTFQELAEVSFAGENRLWDTAQVLGSDERVRVYTDPRPPYGHIELTLAR
jgi:urate oxidase/2-oxo-4-hydroxy-4-carboxy-5-ureidoimidazoline decarboxylase